MNKQNELSYFTLLLMISFASVNAVLFTPALPEIANFFDISNHQAEYTISLYLIGYTIGQLIYGPIANRFGRKPALYGGISLQILSSFLCIASGFVAWYPLLVIGRFFLALGAGVGLKMTFTLVNECYEARIASQKMSYLILSFAITPGLGVALGGILTKYWGWMSCFYAGALYGLILLILVTRLPETKKHLDLNALKLKHLIQGYATQFKNSKLLAGGFLMGGSTSFVYAFAALAPFIAISLKNMDSASYGLANILPGLGLISGSLCAAQFTKQFSLNAAIKVGLYIACVGVLMMLLATIMNLSVWLFLFAPMMIIYFGLAFVMASAPTIAMNQTDDKAHGSAVMNFINMGIATIIVLGLGFFPYISPMMLPVIFVSLCIVMIVIDKLVFTDSMTNL